MEEILIFFYSAYGHEKYKNNKNLMFMLIHVDLTFRVWLEEGSKDEKKNIPRKKEQKHVRLWSLGPYFQALMALHMSLSTSKQIYFISNLGPNNEPRNAQISHYWPQDFWALTPRVT
jgi:hypothetical protein